MKLDDIFGDILDFENYSPAMDSFELNELMQQVDAGQEWSS